MAISMAFKALLLAFRSFLGNLLFISLIFVLLKRWIWFLWVERFQRDSGPYWCKRVVSPSL